MKIKIYFLTMCLSTFFSTHPFSYDSAIYAAQKGDIQSADEQMRRIAVNSPDSADVLYDAGVCAHELQHFNQATAYFVRAAEHAHDNKNLQFRAYFNAGNAAVGEKDLKKALTYYDQALTIEPDNEYARHNRDRVAQMLQEQENKQNQSNNDKNKDQQKDEQDQDQKNDQENQQDQNQSGQGNNEQQDGSNKNDQQNPGNQNQKQQNNDSSQDESKKQSQKTNEGKDSKQSNTGKDGKHQRNQAQNQQNSAHDKKRNGDEGLDEKPQNTDNKRKQQQSKQHGKSPEKQDKTGDENSIASQSQQEQSSFAKASADTSSDASADVSIDPWLMNILNEQELQDKAMNKKLMEARVRQHGGGKNGQNNW